MRNYFAEIVYATAIPRTIRLGEAPSFGKSIFEYEPNGRGAQAYRALANEFIERHAPKPVESVIAAPASEVPTAEVAAEPATVG